MSYVLREIANPLAIHGIFDSLERAKQHLREVIRLYVRRSYFSDKTLTVASFEVVERKQVRT